jgi:hypothetical protein
MSQDDIHGRPDQFHGEARERDFRGRCATEEPDPINVPGPRRFGGERGRRNGQGNGERATMDLRLRAT